jgi:hypothetical protein
MSQPSNLESLPHADRVALAIQAIKSNASLSQQRAAAAYNMPKTTLQRQCVKPASTRVIYYNTLKLQRHKEDAIMQYIRKLNKQGFTPMLSYVQEIANQLLAAYSSSQTRIN